MCHFRFTQISLTLNSKSRIPSHIPLLHTIIAQIGTLMVDSAKKIDSGNYTCSPSNSPTSMVTLHVINSKCKSHLFHTPTHFAPTHMWSGGIKFHIKLAYYMVVYTNVCRIWYINIFNKWHSTGVYMRFSLSWLNRMRAPLFALLSFSTR